MAGGNFWDDGYLRCVQMSQLIELYTAKYFSFHPFPQLMNCMLFWIICVILPFFRSLLNFPIIFVLLLVHGRKVHLNLKSWLGTFPQVEAGMSNLGSWSETMRYSCFFSEMWHSCEVYDGIINVQTVQFKEHGVWRQRTCIFSFIGSLLTLEKFINLRAVVNIVGLRTIAVNTFYSGVNCCKWRNLLKLV